MATNTALEKYMMLDEEDKFKKKEFDIPVPTPEPVVSEKAVGPYDGIPDYSNPTKSAYHEKITDDSARRALFSGATPLLVGLLTGNTRGMSKLAGKAILDEDTRAQKQQEKLIDYLRKEQTETNKSNLPSTGKRRFTFPTAEDEFGNQMIARGDTFGGGIELTPFKKGYKRIIKTEPKTGELVDISGSTGRGREFKTSFGRGERTFNVKDEKDVRSLRSLFRVDKIVDAARKSMSSSGRAIELLKSGNPIADEGIKTIFPRMFGEVGNLAYQEQERFAGNPALQAKWERWKEKYFLAEQEGKDFVLPDEDRASLLEVAQIMGDYSRNQLKFMASQYAGSEAKLTGLNKAKIASVLTDFTDLPKHTGKIAKSVGKDFELRIVGKDKAFWEWAKKNPKNSSSSEIIKRITKKYSK